MQFYDILLEKLEREREREKYKVREGKINTRRYRGGREMVYKGKGEKRRNYGVPKTVVPSKNWQKKLIENHSEIQKEEN